MLIEIWDRATTTQPALSWEAALALAVLALLLTWSPVGYRLVRHLVTLLHEAGHALVARLVGRRVRGIRLHSDTSGLTVSHGRAAGPGMVAMLVAGYPAPSVVGVLGALLLRSGYAAGLLWALLLACALMLLLVRNLYGLWVVVATSAVVAALSWWAAPPAVTGTAYLVVWTLLLAAPPSVVELQRQRRHRRDRTSDADQLAAVTGLPAVVWVAGFWSCCAIALLLGVLLLVPVPASVL